MIGVLLVTHGAMGRDLVDTATSMLGQLSLPTDIITVRRDEDPEHCLLQAQRAAAALDNGDGVIVLTDAFGSTPSNIANGLCNQSGRRAVAGVNLPMLVRIYNYPTLPLAQMVTSAVQAGRDGVVACEFALQKADENG